MPIYSRHFEIYAILTPRLCIDMVFISCLSLERVETVSKLSTRGRRGWIRWQRGSRSTCNLPVGGFPQPASSSSDTRSQGGTELDHKLEHPGRSEYGRSDSIRLFRPTAQRGLLFWESSDYRRAASRCSARMNGLLFKWSSGCFFFETTRGVTG